MDNKSQMPKDVRGRVEAAEALGTQEYADGIAEQLGYPKAADGI